LRYTIKVFYLSKASASRKIKPFQFGINQANVERINKYIKNTKDLSYPEIKGKELLREEMNKVTCNYSLNFINEVKKLLL
jgi:hypothetical protein